ncbi:thiamine-phosphate kinase [Alistipes ihumii]|uniref:thiamine-phosphate kinase n=1 Tax=Alistipes ihumii TaxID=1470347 RepID=UPI002665094A|nr:thiamine-phosphate kinase [Alistipes ihumii]
MQLNELGEFGLIGLIREKFASVSAAGYEGIGDDCAVIPCGDGTSLVVTTDMLIEEVHFRLCTTDPYRLGRKSLAVNLSDIAAMGAAPAASFLSIALPPDTAVEWVERFLDGYCSLSSEFFVPLLGGDTTASPGKLAISVTAVGRVPDSEIKRRASARPGDRIFVTGTLGDSAQGLADLREGRPGTEFVSAHLDPKPYVREGAWLGKQRAVRAMMDLSDGLASDLGHILKASGAGAEISVERIPTRTTVELAVTGGEDYRLLLTADPDEADALIERYAQRFGTPLYEIGRIIEGSGIRWKENGRAIRPRWQGFRHF